MLFVKANMLICKHNNSLWLECCRCLFYF